MAACQWRGASRSSVVVPVVVPIVVIVVVVIVVIVVEGDLAGGGVDLELALVAVLTLDLHLPDEPAVVLVELDGRHRAGGRLQRGLGRVRRGELRLPQGGGVVIVVIVVGAVGQHLAAAGVALQVTPPAVVRADLDLPDAVVQLDLVDLAGSRLQRRRGRVQHRDGPARRLTARGRGRRLRDRGTGSRRGALPGALPAVLPAVLPAGVRRGERLGSAAR